MLRPFPCIFNVAQDLTVHGAWSPRASETLHHRLLLSLLPHVDFVRLPGCSQLDLFALMFLPVWALVNI